MAIDAFTATSQLMLRVNGELIDPNLLEDAFARIKSEAEARLQVSCCERDPEFMEQAEEEVIDSVLKSQPDDPLAALATQLYEKHGHGGAHMVSQLRASRPSRRAAGSA